MSLAEAMRDEVSVEECLDELGEALRTLEHVPPTLLAVALRVHLETLLQALLESHVCTRAEVRAFVRELERESLAYGED
ncbi:MAG TPA: hypothetical protein VLV29_04625 [Steroidobacteraceae bacterium]|nr:hypothetical protein [Steroidobacteraceae bacterium]